MYKKYQQEINQKSINPHTVNKREVSHRSYPVHLFLNNKRFNNQDIQS